MRKKRDDWKEACGTLVKKGVGNKGEVILHFLFSTGEKHYIWKEKPAFHLPSFLQSAKLQHLYKKEKEIQKLPVGSKLILLYNPLNPKQCILEKRAEERVLPIIG